MQIASVATMAGTATCWAPSSTATVSGFPSARLRWMFSIATVASSTSIPIASANPPRVMMLIVWFVNLSPRNAVKIASGIEVDTITTLRQLPRNAKIIRDTSTEARIASRTTPDIAARTNSDWSKSIFRSSPSGATACIAGIARPVASTTASVDASACFRMAR